MIEKSVLARTGVFLKTAVIILGHGSRSKGAAGAIVKIASEVKKGGRYEIVEHAFLQYASPTIEDALRRCLRKKADRIVIVPFFMQPGVHVTKDLPAFVVKAKKQHPEIDIRVTDYVGTHPLMTKIVEDLVKKQSRP